MSWQRVRGHEPLVAAFSQAERSGRLAHAYFFFGPRGVGKRLFADEFAKALLCEGRSAERLEACDWCAACRLVAAGTHPDLVAAQRPEGSSAIPIDVVRELCRHLALKPARGGRKIAILDDADDLYDPVTNHAAANAFLKTLEEPPPGSVLVLIGTDPEQQLPTIISRCQLICFRPLPGELMTELLRQQGITDPALVRRLVRLSGGSLGRALALADPALWEFRRTLIDGLCRTPPEPTGLARRWTQFVEEAGKDSASQRQRASLGLGLVIDFWASALARSVGGDQPPLEPEDESRLQTTIGRFTPEQLLHRLDRCLEAEIQLERRAQLPLVLEGLVDALIRR
ncbi:MAG: DNA polymerase III subunit delta' [Gemmataceae bacterium]|nr:DNA polymerase III subunit delta' [Gemmataceae bacterium]MDW8264642.1 DNA polymerase III subunit delta' [Gemmataceae bacterium]